MAKISLTEEQEKIVNHSGTPLRVLAGPGTGKTLCIIEKIQYLINVKKIPYHQISAITFTNAAAGELRIRLIDSGVKPDQLPYVNTLHGMALRIVKSHMGRAGFTIEPRVVDGITQQILFKDVVEELKQKGLKFTRRDIKIFKDAQQQKLSRAGLPEGWEGEPLRIKNLGLFEKCYKDNLDFYNAFDWVSIVHSAMELIQCYSDIKKEVNEITQYLLVDEFQDLNPLEHEFINTICNDPNGLCVFGDDDQSIYETFRFADPKGIIDFDKKYGNVKSLNISLCRRCPPDVINSALKLIQNNKKRVPKTLEPYDRKKKGFCIILGKRSKKVEIVWIVSKIKELCAGGKYNYKDMMILFTDPSMAQDYISALEAEKIPLDKQLKSSNIFGTECFHWFIATICWLINNNDNLSIRQCMDYWPGIGTETIRQLKYQAISSGNTIWETVENISHNPNAFKKIINRKKLCAFHGYLEQLNKCKKFSDIVDHYFSNVKGCNEDAGSRELADHIKSFSGQEEVVNLQEILEDFNSKKDELEVKHRTKPEAVRIMTMHSAKGCQAPIVFIPAMEEEVMPGLKLCNIEEKRRLFYVSLTRAKVGVYLSWASQRSGTEIHKHGSSILGRKPSRFIAEIGTRNRINDRVPLTP